jgi:phosphinothricin acetyltransferase
MRIEPMIASHADAVLSIYQAGIDEGNAAFETTAPTWDEFDSKRMPDHRFVAVDEADAIVGWVAAVPVSDRCVYAGVVEYSVYVHPTARGIGLGRALLDTLINSTEQAGIWTIQSGVFPENQASMKLPTGAGFRIVGTRERIAEHHGVWRDVVLIASVALGSRTTHRPTSARRSPDGPAMRPSS